MPSSNAHVTWPGLALLNSSQKQGGHSDWWRGQFHPSLALEEIGKTLSILRDRSQPILLHGEEHLLQETRHEKPAVGEKNWKFVLVHCCATYPHGNDLRKSKGLFGLCRAVGSTSVPTTVSQGMEETKVYLFSLSLFYSDWNSQSMETFLHS